MLIVSCVEKTKIKKKEAGNGPFKKRNRQNASGLKDRKRVDPALKTERERKR